MNTRTPGLKSSPFRMDSPTLGGRSDGDLILGGQRIARVRDQSQSVERKSMRKSLTQYLRKLTKPSTSQIFRHLHNENVVQILSFVGGYVGSWSESRDGVCVCVCVHVREGIADPLKVLL